MAAVTTAVIGVGTAAYGAYSSHNASKEQSAAQQSMLAEQQRQEKLRRRAMELDARRRSMEAIRNQQRARSLALTNATAQNASQGSGLQGGYGQIGGQTSTNLLGISQNLQLGRQMFASNLAMSQYQGQYAEAGADVAFGKGLMSFGQSIFNVAPQIGALSKGVALPYSGGASEGSRSWGAYMGPEGSNPWSSANTNYWSR